jgi:transposase-like protein
MVSKATPTNLLEAIRYFSDQDVCVDFVAALRWPDGPACPKCQGTEYTKLTTRRVWKCKTCKHQYSVKVGTIFEDSALGLDKWLPAIWLVANSKNGISSYELARSVGCTQKSAWFMLHRIRLAMQTGSFTRFDGEVEVDETFIGGLSKNMHKAKRTEKIGKRRGGPAAGKTIVVGSLQRGDGLQQSSTVRAEILPNSRRATLHAHVRDNVEPGSDLYTDAYHAYWGLEDDYFHGTIDHATAYVNGRVHTNGIENFWSLLKRGLHGTYVSVHPAHLFRYIDERVFTFNLRDLTDLGRFTMVLQQVSGRRLTYAALTGKSPV